MPSLNKCILSETKSIACARCAIQINLGLHNTLIHHKCKCALRMFYMRFINYYKHHKFQHDLDF